MPFPLQPGSFFASAPWRRTAIFILGLVWIPACLHAEPPLKIALVSEVASVAPGQAFHVGLHLQHKEGYHTYWKFPGVVGVPVDMIWDLPPGWKAGPIEWPEPERVHMFQIRAQGYHGEVLLPMKLTPPKALTPGEKVVLKGKAVWMCCGRDCNPDFAELSLTLPIAEQSSLQHSWRKAFAKARASLPQPMDPSQWRTTASRNGNRVTLRLEALTSETRKQLSRLNEVLFFTEDGYIHADKDQHLRKEGDSALSIDLTISEYYDGKGLPDKLLGVLQSPQSWGDKVSSHSLLIRAPFQ